MAYVPPSINFTVIPTPGAGGQGVSFFDLNISSGTSSTFPTFATTGLIDAWCLDRDITINTVPIAGVFYTANLYSTATAELGILQAAMPLLAANGTLLNQLDSVNWLLNSYYKGTLGAGGIWQNVQGAMWALVGENPTANNEIAGGNQAQISALTAQALLPVGSGGGDGYVADQTQNQYLTVVADPRLVAPAFPVANGSTGQPLIIPVLAARLGDFVWLDANTNGLQDGNEAGVNGVTVTLFRDLNNSNSYDAGDLLLGTTVTGDDPNTAGTQQGFYQFNGLTPGFQYQVQFTAPAGFGFTTPDVNANGSDLIDSDASLVTGAAPAVTLAPGQFNGSLDAGLVLLAPQPASLGDRLWVDTNADGKQNDGATGIVGATVTLIGGGADGLISTTGDNTTATTTTGVDGFYNFAGLTPGVQYQVQFADIPAGTVFTAPNVSANGFDLIDSDAIVVDGKTQIVTLAQGENNPTLDAGVFTPAKLSGFVYQDVGNDGVRNAEPAIAGVLITLTGTDGLGNPVTATTTTNAAGFYEFVGLLPGSYTVTETQPGAFLDGKDTAGTPGGGTAGNDVISTITLVSGTNSVENNFGELVAASLGDRLWVDTNADGKQNDGATGIAGRTVTLIGGGADGLISTTGDNTTATTTTGVDGFYNFAGLTPGVQYQVQFADIPAGTVFTAPNVSANGFDLIDSDAIVVDGKTQIVTLAQGENNPTLDAGVFTPAKLSGFVYQDVGNDGVRNAEPAIAGVLITLTGTDGLGNPVTATTTTNAAGFYEFVGLLPGSYTVTETQPGAFLDGKDTAGTPGGGTAGNDVISTITLVSGTNSVENNFGELVAASLGDRLWVDTNADGKQNDGATGIVGATVTLIGGGADGLISTTGDNTTATTTTGVDGFYNFAGLTPGVQYQVQFADIPAGTVFTAPNVSADGFDLIDSDAIVVDGKTQIVTLAQGENNPTLDAGVFTPAKLSGFVYQDVGNDGVRNAEPAIAGVLITLTGTDGLGNPVTATTTTNAAGFYEFVGLLPGSYTVTETQPGAFLDGKDTAGTPGGGTAGNDVISTITLVSGTNSVENNFGELVAASLGDRLWVDTNADGKQNDGATGIAGRTVTLIGGGADGLIATTGDNTTATTTTGVDGFYNFAGLTPGVQYQVQFADIPAGTVFTAPNVSANGFDLIDSDAIVVDGKTQIVTLAQGENNPTLDAGVFTPAKLSGFVYQDVGNDGVRNAEPAIAGVLITLTGTDGLGNPVTATTTTNAAGFYEFVGLLPGSYTVTETQPGAFLDGKDTAGTPGGGTAGNDVISTITLVSGTNSVENNFGELVAASLGDRLWVDTNADGKQNDGATGIVGATVTLIGGGADGLISTTGDNTTATTTTGVDGFYNFAGLTPGVQYQVQFADIPAGTVFTAPNVSANGFDLIDSDAIVVDGKTQIVTLAQGENNPTLDAGVFTPAKLSGFVYQDVGNDGVRNAEPAIAGVLITLTGTDGLGNPVTATTTTNAAGFYEFVGLLPGSYTVTETQPGAFLDGKDTAGTPGGGTAGNDVISTITLVSGTNSIENNFGELVAATLGDRLFTDANGNGVQDGTEVGISGQTVTLIGGGADGLISTAGDNTTATTTTGADGIYNFAGLTPGVQYQVQFAAPAGTVFTGQDLGGDDTKDSDVGNDGKTQIVTLTSGENNPTLDAGVYAPAAIGDKVFEDKDGDGKQGVNEPGIAGATVTLFTCVGGVPGVQVGAPVLTDVNGNYSFTGLKPGDYIVRFTTPAGGFVQTTANVGADGFDATDSDAGTGGFTGCYTLTSGQTNTTVDAGFYKTASLGDRLFTDANGNGVQDGTEVGISGQTVTLIGGGADGLINGIGDTTTTTTTGANGIYGFTGLTPGVQYQVQFAAPAGTVFTGRDLGGDDTKDSDVGNDGKTQIVTLGSGENNLTLDAGVFGSAIDIEKLVRGEYMTGSTGGTEGLTPGFWKTHSVFGPAPLAGWPETGYSPTQSWESVFGLVGNATVPGTPTLLDALGAGGGGVNALLRHATAALLNAANPNVDYLFSVASIISSTKSAILSGNATTIDNLKDQYANQNELGANLSTPAPTGTTVVTPDVDADTAGSGPQIPVGGTAVFTYIVRNLGTVEISNVRVTDNRLANVGFVGGDTDNDGRLDATETWTYTARETVTSSANIANIGTVTGLGGGVIAVTDNDAANYNGSALVQSLGDFVWTDANANGRQDAGELGLAGLTITLTGGGADGLINGVGDTTATTTTDADGFYNFNGLASGVQYQVQFSKPAGSVYTLRDNLPGDDVNDSDADVTTGRSQIVTLAVGQNNPTLDAGVFFTASLGDRLWTDANANGIQDGTETGIVGQTITLIGGGADRLINGVGDTTATVVTGANGIYNFSNLTPGVQYQVQFSKPTNTVYTTRDVSGNTLDATDSDADTTTGRSQIVTLVSGENNTTIDAGVIVQTPGIDIEKTTSGTVNSNPVAADYNNEDTANGAGVPLLNPGAAVTWTYQVTNTGNTNFARADISIVDDNGTTGTTADDLTTANGKVTYQSGDTGNDSILSPGEVWLYRATGTVQTLSTAPMGNAVTIDMQGNTALDGTDGNTRSYTSGAVSVNVNAFSRDKTTGSWATGYLGAYGGGLGVTDTGEGTGAGDTHTVDNTGGRDNYVVYRFNQDVVVDAAFLGYVVGDSDVQVWIGTVANAFTAGVALSDSVLAGLGFTEVNLTDLTTTRTADFNAGNRAGNVLVIAADTTDITPEDFFKIQNLTLRLPGGTGVYSNLATVTAPGTPSDSDRSHYKNPALASLGDRLWNDANANGIQDTGETGIVGQTITLIGGGVDGLINGVGDTTANVVTGANGIYNFNSLAPGVQYQVQFSKPANTVYTTRDVGGNTVASDATDSDVDTGTGRSQIVTLTPGQNNPTIDAGVVTLNPRLDIEKTTSGTGNANHVAATYDNEDTPFGAGVPILTAGAAVTWTYQVTNTGNTDFARNAITIVDDDGTPANTADDLTIANGRIQYVSGDTGNDNVMKPGEVWLYRATDTVQNLSGAPVGNAVTINMQGNTAQDGTDGNTRSYTSGAVSVNVNAFSRDKTTGGWATAYLGAYGSGLGVTDSSEGSGSGDTHTVDNMDGRDNYVVYRFNQSVVVDSAYLGYVVGDSDVQVWIGTLPNAFTAGVTLSDSVLASLGFTQINETTSTTERLADLNAGNVAGNVLVIAANTTEPTNEDRFKIESVTVRMPGAGGVYANKATVSAAGASGDSDLSHYRNPSPTGGMAGSKFFVVDSHTDAMYGYTAAGAGTTSGSLAAANLDPRGVTGDALGTRVWVLDRNDSVYVYNTAGTHLGNWVAGGLAAEPEGIALDGQDMWIVERSARKVTWYNDAASQLSGTDAAEFTFVMPSHIDKAKGITSNGTFVWIVEDDSANTVYRYTIARNAAGDVTGLNSLVSWTLDARNATPTGITVDPTGASQSLWVVDIGTDTVYEYANAVSRTSGTAVVAAATFKLGAANLNAQDIFDPLIGSTAADAIVANSGLSFDDMAGPAAPAVRLPSMNDLLGGDTLDSVLGLDLGGRSADMSFRDMIDHSASETSELLRRLTEAQRDSHLTAIP